MISLIFKYYLFFKYIVIKTLFSSSKSKLQSCDINTSIYQEETILNLKTDYLSGLYLNENNLNIDVDFKNIITKICYAINESILDILPEFKNTEIYKQLQTQREIIYERKYEKEEIFKLINFLFMSPISLLKILCPNLSNFEICLLILIKSDLRISNISLYFNIYDPSVLYQRKYRIKKKIYSQKYGEKIYISLFNNK